MYIPPVTVSAEAINLIAEISGQIERYAIRLEQEDGLRKANRIKTIHSSLAIEGNTLTEDEVRDIIDGKNVVAPIKQIQEVKNAIATYELYPKLNPFSVKDLLKAHGVMMQALVDDAGKFRRSGVGVFSEHGLVHMAPPADRVPMLMDDLFGWLKESKDHLLIRSCVFHYEFEFIHPFIDGNGRTGRLWQSLILGKLHPLFEHLPVENMVYANQQAYYDAITASTNAGQSGPFIDFMLNEIFKTLKAHQGEPLPDKVPSEVPNKVPNKLRNKYPELSDAAWDVYTMIKGDTSITSKELGAALGISDRMVRKYISMLREANLIVRMGSNKTGYWKVNTVK
jgi:Fic family protein